MIVLTHQHFAIEFSYAGDRYRMNGSMDVLCASVDRALEMFREHNADATIHSIRRVGQSKRILIDGGGIPDEESSGS